MKYCITTVTILLILFYVSSGFGAIIKLKSGVSLSCDILERNSDYVKIRYKGSEIYYEMRYIDKIEEDTKNTEDSNLNNIEYIMEENNKLKKELKELKELIRNIIAEYNVKLGDVYVQAELFEEAIKAYENALIFNPNNADVEYNLGVLYETYKNDKAKSIEHYRNYLYLKPDAPDRDEIEKIINVK